ncbi:uncharacterized protein [Pyrus communis]|uniref:uncharacterized protein n=1 Tax=Pyrus communis TaxID=23211 RepID=UPI0035C09F0D
MRREDDESDEEDEAWRNAQNRAATMVCQPTAQQTHWGGFVAGPSYKPRNRMMTHANLMNNYFNLNLVYTEKDFRRRFRIRRHVFKRLLHDVQQVNPYFQQKQERAGHAGFSPHQKVTIALRMIAYGSSADPMDETHGISESSCLDTLEQFYVTIVQVYKDKYLREPNQEDLDRLIHKAEDRGFPNMIGSLDYMHWDWNNCPTRWQRGFYERLRMPTVVLEAIASYDTWIWHALFRVPRSQNDITVLGRSPLFNSLTEGKAP